MRLLMYLMLMQFACVMMSPVHKREGTGDLSILLQCPNTPSSVPSDPHTLLTKEQSSNFNWKLLQLKKSASCCLNIDESTGSCAESRGIKVNMVVVSSGLGVKVEEHFDMYDEFGAPCTSKTPGVSCMTNITVDKTTYGRAAEYDSCETPIWLRVAEIVVSFIAGLVTACVPIYLYLKKKCTTGENATLAPTTTETQERLLDETTTNGHEEAKLNEN